MNHNRYWGDLPRPKSKSEFFNAVTALTPDGEGRVATIRLYGPIDSWGGWWGVSAKEMGQVLDALPESVDQIVLRINSPGGEVFEGVTILNMLRAHRATVTAVTDGRACSAASVIASGCDEHVMSPGTQMMIHSPWVVTLGNATDLRKSADVLDGIESSMIEIYTAKAGEKDWKQLLADETWLTGPQAVELGLANRIGVVQDLGDAETVGAEPIIITFTDDDDEAEDAAAPLIAARVAASIKLPVSAEPGVPNRKENLVAYEDLTAGLRERLGVTDAAATDEAILAAVDALRTRAEVTAPPTIPEGVQMIDSAVLADLQAAAAQGVEARAEQTRTRREGILNAAQKDGRITPTSRESWANMLAKDEEGTVKVLDLLPTNTAMPITEIGLSDEIANADAALEDAAGWNDTEEVA